MKNIVLTFAVLLFTTFPFFSQDNISSNEGRDLLIKENFDFSITRFDSSTKIYQDGIRNYDIDYGYYVKVNEEKFYANIPLILKNSGALQSKRSYSYSENTRDYGKYRSNFNNNINKSYLSLHNSVNRYESPNSLRFESVNFTVEKTEVKNDGYVLTYHLKDVKNYEKVEFKIKNDEVSTVTFFQKGKKQNKLTFEGFIENSKIALN